MSIKLEKVWLTIVKTMKLIVSIYWGHMCICIPNMKSNPVPGGGVYRLRWH